jgi:hypothetical protein
VVGESTFVVKRFWFLLLLPLLIFSGCYSSLPIGPAQSSFRSGNYIQAYDFVESLEKAYQKGEGELLYNLDLGTLAHYGSLYEKSIKHLERSELLIKHLYTQSITENISSYLVSDNTKAYQGEDYEDLYLNIFQALNYVALEDGEAALVELRRLVEKEQLLKNKYQKIISKGDSYNKELNLPQLESIKFSHSAFGSYLSMIINRSLGYYDESLFFYNQVKEAFKTQSSLYPFSLPASLESELLVVDRGSKRVNFVAFSGTAPQKVEVVDRFWFSPSNYIKIALPTLVGSATKVNSIEILFSDGSLIFLEPIESIGLIARDTFKLRLGAITTKTIIRSYLKATGVAVIDVATQDSDNSLGLFGPILSLASRIFNEASEQADLRMSHFFPDQVWVGGVTMKEGTYDAKVIYKDRNGTIMAIDEIKDLRVSKNGLNLFESFYPR